MKKLKAWDLHEDEETASNIKEMHVQQVKYDKADEQYSRQDLS